MTRALLFEGEIRDREQQKSMRREIPVSGFDVFLSSFTKALLSYSRRAPVYFTSEAAALSFQRNPPPWLEGLKDRIQLVSAYDPSPLKKCEDLILLSVGPEMLNFSWIRSQLHRPDWPIVAIMHSVSAPPRIRYFLTNALFDRLYPHDALVCATQAAKKAVQNLFLSVPPEVRVTEQIPFEIPVIPFGVDTQEFESRNKESVRQKLGIKAHERVILCFGKLSPTEKSDLLPLLIAYSQLREKEGVKLFLAGDDTQFRMAEGLRGAAQELGCGPVEVLPDVSKEVKLDLLAAADIFVSPSDNTQESFSLSIAEAMAAGLPVVASDWAGHGELVEDGKTGFLVSTFLPPISQPVQLITLYSGVYPEKLYAMSTVIDVNRLAQSLQNLLDNSELRHAMGEEARRRARSRLDWKIVMGQYDDLWDFLSDRAKSATRSCDPFVCSSLQDVFAHYATASLQPDHTVQFNENLCSKSAQILSALGASPNFEAAVFTSIIGVLEAEGAATLERVIAAACQSIRRPRTIVEQHVGRLLKYGVIRMDAMTSDTPCPENNNATAGRIEISAVR